MFTFLLPREAKLALSILEEVEFANQDSIFFGGVKATMVGVIKKNPQYAVNTIRGGVPPRQYVYATVVNVIGDMLESGRCSVYRGVLSMQGQDLLRVHDNCVDELIKIGHEPAEDLEQLKRDIRQRIKEAG